MYKNNINNICKIDTHNNIIITTSIILNQNKA